jgi:hypothetical protein
MRNTLGLKSLRGSGWADTAPGQAIEAGRWGRLLGKRVPAWAVPFPGCRA